MNDEKRNKIAAAITINAVLLIFVIVVVVIVQVIKIGVLTKRKNGLYNEYYALVEERDNLTDWYEKFQKDEELQNVMVEYYKLTGSFPWDDANKA